MKTTKTVIDQIKPSSHELKQYHNLQIESGDDAAETFRTSLGSVKALALYRDLQVDMVWSAVEMFMLGKMDTIRLDRFVATVVSETKALGVEIPQQEAFFRDCFFLAFGRIMESTEDQTSEYLRASIGFFHFAPESLLEVFHQKAVELGLIPSKPDGYSEEGKPLYNLDNIASKLDIDPDDIPQETLEWAHSGQIHRLQ
jgi:hypothetical protein